MQQPQVLALLERSIRPFDQLLWWDLTGWTKATGESCDKRCMSFVEVFVTGD
jgi:hypothetical protein